MIRAKRFFLTSCILLLTIFCIPAAAQKIDSLDIKIGQMIMIGFSGTEVDTAVLREIRQQNVGSIIIFEKNIPKTNSFIALKKIICTYQRAASIPLLIGIDQEGGRVNRLKDKYGFPRSITAFAMGRAQSLDSVRLYAESTAATLAGLGININFAPVVDLAINRNNFIHAAGRTFSANEDSVILLAKEYILQHRKMGVLTSLKHFPGHGSSMDDTHKGMADVTDTWEERELKPYRVLIRQGYADAVMTSHIVNRKLDPDGDPGTLSEDILAKLLRKDMNYNGIIFSDDMQMQAITKNYGTEQAIKMAINAGVDIMTFSNNIAGSDLRTVHMVHGIIRAQVESGEIKRSRIDESYRRIMKFKSRINVVEKNEQKVESARKEVEALRAELKRTQEEAATASKGKKKKKSRKK